MPCIRHRHAFCRAATLGDGCLEGAIGRGDCRDALPAAAPVKQLIHGDDGDSGCAPASQGLYGAGWFVGGVELSPVDLVVLWQPGVDWRHVC